MRKLKIEQTNIFDFIEETNKKYKIVQPIRLIELFAGIGSQAKALKNIGADFEHYKVVEFDKYAIASYNAIHGTNFITQDITKIKGSDLEIVDTNKYCYIMTYSFPCQDLSLAGKQAGMTKGSSTRSGLLWEVERLLNETKELPQILLMENVPQVHGKKNIQDFEKWIEFLQSKGYSNYWKDLNAKDYGIPQNRNRTFMVSILGSYEYEFPKPFELKLRLKDMLEKNVDEKYYLSETLLNQILRWEAQQRPLEKVLGEKSISPTLTARGAGENHSGMVLLCEELEETTNLQEYTKKSLEKIKNNIRDINDCSSTNTANPQRATIDNGNLVVVKEATKKGYAIAEEGDSLNLTYPNSTTRRGRVGKQVSQTLETSCNQAVVDRDLRIRKLTPKECWRLMGFADEDFDNASKVNSNSQLYKEAGNSIVVNVLEEIFKQFFKE